MEEMVMLFAEKGVVMGGFIYMLYLFLGKFTKSQELIVETLVEISANMTEMNDRIARLENKQKE